jgi:hypothetical protein
MDVKYLCSKPEYICPVVGLGGPEPVTTTSELFRMNVWLQQKRLT